MAIQGSRHARFAVVLGSLSAAAIVFGPASLGAATTVVVTPTNLQDWALEANGTATISIVTGPATPPAGIGSLAFDTSAAPGGRARAFFAGAPVAGTKIAALTSLKYSTYTTQYSDQSQFNTGYLVLEVDKDGDPATTDTFFVVFEPCYTTTNFCGSGGPVQPLGVWTEWDALANGPNNAPNRWWSFDADDQGCVDTVAASQPPYPAGNAEPWFVSLPVLVTTMCPNAEIVSIRVQAGQTGGGAPWDNYRGNADKLVVAASSGVDVVYDFDPEPAPAPPTTKPPRVPPVAPLPAAISVTPTFAG